MKRVAYFYDSINIVLVLNAAKRWRSRAGATAALKTETRPSIIHSRDPRIGGTFEERRLFLISDYTRAINVFRYLPPLLLSQVIAIYYLCQWGLLGEMIEILCWFLHFVASFEEGIL